MERLIEQALLDAGIDYATEADPRNAAKLDFYLPHLDVYIEVKRMHSDRASAQLQRASNVILAQGEDAVATLADLLRRMR